MTLRGKAFKFGDNISTDHIAPGRLFHLRSNLPELAKHVLEDADPNFAKNMEKGLIEVAPLAYMRGRTLDNAYIILDEAQNTTPAQMKMFLTRIGFGSKAIITGDLSQKDIPKDAISGLDVALKVLKNVDDIGVCQMTSDDVVRHPLIQKIVEAYDRYEESRKASKKTDKRTRNTKQK